MSGGGCPGGGCLGGGCPDTGERLPQKVLDYYLHLTQYMLLQKNLNGHRLKFGGPDSYNPCNSYSNNHLY